MIQNVDPDVEMKNLENEWNLYCSSNRGQYNTVCHPAGVDLTTVFNDIVNANIQTDIRLNQMENMFERLINIVKSSKSIDELTERKITDIIVKHLGE